MRETTAAARTLTLAGAQQVLTAGLGRAERIGIDVCVAVSDRAGALLAFARMDGAPVMSGQLAQDKAYTVAMFKGLPTHQWFDLIRDEPPLLHGIVKTDRLIVFGGGVPVLVDGDLVGAVGVSGGSAEQDREVAEAGAATLAGGEPG
jgi:glc operon protein GlcG